jgi:lipopolysaccharide export system permease protein
MPQGQFLLLSNGQRLESNLSTNELKISEFEVYGTQVSNDVLGTNATEPAKIQNTLTLLNHLNSASSQAELSWRFGMIVAVLNFVIIGLAVSSVNPRVNKSFNLVFSLFTFVTYYNLINLGQSWIVSGKVAASSYMMSLHGGIFVLAVLWLVKGHNNWSLARFFVRRGHTPSPAKMVT